MTKQKGRLDIPWKRLTVMTLAQNIGFHSLDSFFNAMVNKYKQKLIENPIVPNGFTFLIIYKINSNTRLPQIEAFQYFPETKEQQTVGAIGEVMARQVRVSGSEPRMSATPFNVVFVNLLGVEGIETLVIQGTSYEGNNKRKVFDVVIDKELNITELKETKKMDNYIPTYLDTQLQADVEKRKKEMFTI